MSFGLVSPYELLSFMMNSHISISLCLEATRQPSKRRKRKGSSATTEGANNTSRTSKRKQSPIPLQSHHIAQPGVSFISQ